MLPHHRDRIVGILLAAGKGSRFDPSGIKNKLMQTVASDEIIVVAAAKRLLSALPLVVAVVRNTNDAVATKLSRLGCKVVICPNADQGMGESLVYGLKQVPDAAGWIIALGDMPYVQTTTISSLVDALEHGADIAAPVYQEKQGNPVGFGKTHLLELLKLRNDHGARALLQTFSVKTIEVDDPGIHRDIDTPADLTE